MMLFNKSKKKKNNENFVDNVFNDKRVMIESLHFEYGKKPILKDINLTFRSGFNAIIGPNGSGKSTLMKLLTGNLTPSQGKITILGYEIEHLKPIERAKIFAVIGQNQSFSFPFTCIEMVGHGRYARRTDFNHYTQNDFDVMVDCMQKTDTLKFKDQLITELSGGEQQRVILAAALAQKPKVLFLDEAFSAMDISYKAKFFKLLKELVRDEGIMVISILHDLNMAYRFADHICILSEGQVIASDIPEKSMTESNMSKVFNVDVERIENVGFQIII